MTLYELTAEYRQLLDMAEDPDVDPQTLADTMDAVEAELEDKADAYATIIRQLTGDIETIKSEIDRLTARKNALANNIDRLKTNLQYSMTMTGQTKFKTALFSFSVAKNPPSVVMDEQYIENIPERFLIQQEPKIDKKAIKDALKSGEDLTGVAHLEQSEGLRIR